MKKIWCVVAAVALLGTAAFEFVSREGKVWRKSKRNPRWTAVHAS